jgi:hypothetical protein
MTFNAGTSSQFALIKYGSSGMIDWLHVADVQGSTDASTAGKVHYMNDNIWVGGHIGRNVNLFGKDFNNLDTTNFYLASLETDGNLIADFHDGGRGNVRCFGFAMNENTIIVPLWASGDVMLDGKDYPTQDYDIILAQINVENLVAVRDPDKTSSSILFSPNPVKHIMNIHIPPTSYRYVQVVDLAGNILMTSSPLSSLDASGLSPGIYYLRFRYDNYETVRSFVKVD